MRERISRLAKGSVQPGAPILEFPRQTVEASIAYGQNYRGDIHLKSGNQLAFRGLIFSDDSRVLLLQNAYVGVSPHVSYEVVTDGLTEGSVLEGHFSLVYNGGECQLPYRFTILNPGQTQRAPMETLAEFAAYAQKNPKDAEGLFESREFVKLPFMDDLSVRALYDGMRRSTDRRSQLEEFLCGAGAKERVCLHLAETEAATTVDQREKTGSVSVIRNTWGSLSASASSDNAAVVLAADHFTDRDFDGDQFKLCYTIDSERLHTGHNYARITVETALQTMHLELDITCRRGTRPGDRRAHDRRKNRLEFHRRLLRSLALEGDRKSAMLALKRIWQDIVQEDEPTCHQLLYKAAIAYWGGDLGMAVAALEQAKPMAEAARSEEIDTYCAYLHLLVLVTGDWEKREMMQKTLRLYEKDSEMKEDLFLVKMFLEGGVEERPTEILGMIQDYYRAGSTNPYLYLLACRIYNLHPDILKRLDDFQLQTLWFGARMGMLTEDTALQVASMAAGERMYRPILCRILKVLFRRYDRNEILAGICQLLIRSECRSSEDFYWYAQGVARDIRLTRLYDYYLFTVPEDYDEPFPREIMLYFSYNSPKNPEAQRALYRNLYSYSQNDAGIMSSYREQLEDYMRQQIRSGRMDRGTAMVCSDMLKKDAVDENLAHILPDLLLSREVVCEYKGFSEVIAVYGETEEELRVPMHDGVCSVPMFTDRCRLLFADAKGVRYAGVPCSIEPLFVNPKDILDRCFELYPRHSMLRLARCTRILESGECDVEQVRLLRKELETRGLRKEYKYEMMKAITDYVIHRKDPGDEDVITCIRSNGISAGQRIRLVQILIDQGQLSEAAAQIRRIGFRELPMESLVELVNLSIQNGLFVKDAALLDMCCYLFDKEQCSDTALEYLCSYFNASCSRMYPILREADTRGIPLHGMEERLMAQMLYTGVSEKIEDVYEIFERVGTGDDLIRQAYFSVKCRDYFLRDIPAGEDVFRYVQQLMEKAEMRKRVPKICELALCRYYATKPQLTEAETELGREMVDSLYREGMIFAWMKAFRDKFPLPRILSQREWLEFHGDPDQTLMLCAKIQPSREDNGMVNVILPQVYPGIYVYSALLFDGESMSYEIIREEDRTVLKRGVLSGQASPEEDHSSFAEMNRLQKQVKNEKDVLQWQQLVLNYAVQEAWTEQLFTTE